jgi:hypothetical protein
MAISGWDSTMVAVAAHFHIHRPGSRSERTQVTTWV